MPRPPPARLPCEMARRLGRRPGSSSDMAASFRCWRSVSSATAGTDRPGGSDERLPDQVRDLLFPVRAEDRPTAEDKPTEDERTTTKRRFRRTNLVAFATLAPANRTAFPLVTRYCGTTDVLRTSTADVGISSPALRRPQIECSRWTVKVSKGRTHLNRACPKHWCVTAAAARPRRSSRPGDGWPAREAMPILVLRSCALRSS
jgi:hypothetical protein